MYNTTTTESSLFGRLQQSVRIETLCRVQNLSVHAVPTELFISPCGPPGARAWRGQLSRRQSIPSAELSSCGRCARIAVANKDRAGYRLAATAIPSRQTIGDGRGETEMQRLWRRASHNGAVEGGGEMGWLQHSTASAGSGGEAVQGANSWQRNNAIGVTCAGAALEEGLYAHLPHRRSVFAAPRETGQAPQTAASESSAARAGVVARHRRSNGDSVLTASRTAMGPWIIGAGARNECRLPHAA
jgi:hypothetical protein